MATLIIDAPEVVQRTLIEALDLRGIIGRLVPDTRTDVAHPDQSPTGDLDSDLKRQALGADTAVWFADERSSSPRQPGDVVKTLAAAAVARVILVTPLREPGQPLSPAAALLHEQSDRFASGIVTVASAPVFGPGDELVSRLLIMMRSLPAIPLLARGQRESQPVWHEDLAALLVRLHDPRPGPSSATYRVAGADVVTHASLYAAIAPLIDRHPARVPVPDFLSRLGLAVIDAASGTDTATADRAWAVEADEVTLRDGDNDLERLLGRPPTTLHTALRRMVLSLPEQLPDTGVGTLDVKHFWGDIRNTPLSPEAVLGMVRSRFREVMPVPVGVEPVAADVQLDPGRTITIHLPGRGHVQVRVEAADDAHVVLSTVRGHPLAGVVRFRTAAARNGVRFEVMTGDKAATPIDWLALTLGGARVQDANWRRVVQKIGELAGGTVDTVHQHARSADDQEVQHLSTYVARLIESRRT
jgi:hypothetical protein